MHYQNDRTEQKLNYYNRELINHRNELIKNISKMVNPMIIERFVTILTYARSEDVTQANELSNLFDLDEMDFSALLYDIDSFKDYYISREEDNYCKSIINE